MFQRARLRGSGSGSGTIYGKYLQGNPHFDVRLSWLSKADTVIPIPTQRRVMLGENK